MYSANDIIDETARLHSTVVIAQGMSYGRDEYGRPKHKEHTGRVVIRAYVYVGPYTVLHRARLPGLSTYLGDYVQIGALNNIGHHVMIQDNTIVTQGVCIGGSSTIGRNCFIGMNATIRQHVHITHGVFVGMGSVVTKDLDRKGVYYGNPARWQGDWDGTW